MLNFGLLSRRHFFTTFGSFNYPVPIDTVIMSRKVQTQVTGAISITAGTGEYQINGGLWVSTPGTVEVGDKVRVRLTSSTEYETLSELEITIDGVVDTFSVTTVADTTTFGPTWDEPGTWDDNKIWSEA